MSARIDLLLGLGRPLIMGILNLTPDSFSDGAPESSVEKFLSRAQKLMEDGADILDIGGESTRPGAAEISVDEELSRVEPFLKLFRQCYPDFPLSLDTRRFAVAEALAPVGIDILNDVSFFSDVRFARLTCQYKCHYILMHSRGTPQTMTTLTQYLQGIVPTVIAEIRARIESFIQAGGRTENLIVDPGFGFAKSPEQCLEMVERLNEFRTLPYPLLLGVSRKRFLQLLVGECPPAERDDISARIGARAALAGFRILRVHDVARTRKALCH